MYVVVIWRIGNGSLLVCIWSFDAERDGCLGTSVVRGNAGSFQ